MWWKNAQKTFYFYQLTHKNYRHGLINHLRGGLISICTKSFLTVPDFSVFLVARGVLEGVQNSPSRAGCHRMNWRSGGFVSPRHRRVHRRRHPRVGTTRRSRQRCRGRRRRCHHTHWRELNGSNGGGGGWSCRDGAPPCWSSDHRHWPLRVWGWVRRHDGWLRHDDMVSSFSLLFRRATLVHRRCIVVVWNAHNSLSMVGSGVVLHRV